MHADRRIYGDRKRGLLGGLTGTVVEIGAGAGPNARYLAAGTRWIAVEPNVHFHRHLRRAARGSSLWRGEPVRPFRFEGPRTPADARGLWRQRPAASGRVSRSEGEGR